MLIMSVILSLSNLVKQERTKTIRLRVRARTLFIVHRRFMRASPGSGPDPTDTYTGEKDV